MLRNTKIPNTNRSRLVLNAFRYRHAPVSKVRSLSTKCHTYTRHVLSCPRWLNRSIGTSLVNADPIASILSSVDTSFGFVLL